MTQVEQSSLAKAVATVIREHVQKAFTPLREDIEALKRDNAAKDRRIAALELAQKNSRYCGVWQQAQAETYAKGNLVTFDGSLWIAIDDAPSKPGVRGWQLAAKRGADAR